MSRGYCAAILSLFLVIPVFGQTGPSDNAKPDTSQEALVFDQVSDRYRYEIDGTGDHIASAVIRIQSQAAVEEFGQLVLGYNSAFETLDVDYVRVRKPGGETVNTPASSLQDFAPEILKSAPMYSDYREKHVSVVGLRPGDILEYQTTTHIKTAMVPGEFWVNHTFPKDVVVHEARLEVDVPKSRAVHLKSPDRTYETHESADRRTYTWVVRDIVPDRKPKKNIFDFDFDNATFDAQLTTFADWQEVAHWYAKLQGQQVVVNDTIRKKADELTRGAASPDEKARRLYDFVARNIRYVSLSFGIGRYQPHTSVEVLQNGYGDCKDKHTLLAALLSAAGIQSYPVLINSSIKLDPDVPSPAQFDHVITAARLGKDFTWLDSTAEVAPYGLILYQLRNKQALLASDDSNAGLQRTPADAPIKNTQVIAIDGKLSETGVFDSSVDITATGDSDFPLRATFRGVPQPDWPRLLEYVTKGFGLDGDVSDITVGPLEDTTKPFHLHYRLHRDGYFSVPGRFDRAVPLPPVAIKGDRAKAKPTEPIDIGPATDITYRAHLQLAPNYDVRLAVPVRISRDYAEYSSSYRLSKNLLEAERHWVLKVNELPGTRKSDLQSVRSVLQEDAVQTMSYVITPASRAAEESAAAGVGDNPEDLMKAGNGALQRRDFETAAKLFQRVVAKDPKYEKAWDSLGHAYAALNNHDEAIKAFQKQIELDAYDQSANRELAEQLQQAGRNDDDITAYGKHLEIVPLDPTAHKNLGLLLVSLKRDTDARPELEAASRISPDDSEVQLALAQLYARIGEADKATALAKGVTGGSSASSADDPFSAALGDDADPNRSTQDARRALTDIGDHFDAGDYDQLNASVFSAMRFVSLAWARIGWASYLHQENMTSLQFLESSWLLSRSGTVANRLGRLYQEEGQRDKARHMFALAVAAGGPDAQKSKDQVVKLSADPDAAQQELGRANAELVQARSIKVPSVTKTAGSAQFNLVFDSSNQPERVQFVSGDEALRSASEPLMKLAYPVKFPDVSSIKIVHRGTLSCIPTGCTMVLTLLDRVQ